MVVESICRYPVMHVWDLSAGRVQGHGFFPAGTTSEEFRMVNCGANGWFGNSGF